MLTMQTIELLVSKPARYFDIEIRVAAVGTKTPGCQFPGLVANYVGAADSTGIRGGLEPWNGHARNLGVATSIIVGKRNMAVTLVVDTGGWFTD